MPSGGLLGTSGVESGKAAPLVGGPPGVELHTVVDELPSGDTGEMVPVVLPVIDVGMVPNGFAGISAVALPVVDVAEVGGTADMVDGVETDGVVPVVLPIANMEVTGTDGVPGAICPIGVKQMTTVPGVAGSEARGTGASVVSGAPGSVVAENGLGP